LREAQLNSPILPTPLGLHPCLVPLLSLKQTNLNRYIDDHISSHRQNLLPRRLLGAPIRGHRGVLPTGCRAAVCPIPLVPTLPVLPTVHPAKHHCYDLMRDAQSFNQRLTSSTSCPKAVGFDIASDISLATSCCSAMSSIRSWTLSTSLEGEEVQFNQLFTHSFIRPPHSHVVVC